MNWLDTETKAILQKVPDSKLAPSKVGEFALVLLRKGADHSRLVRAICRINDCSEAASIETARLAVPVAINTGLTEAEALFGQFELICCNAVAVFVRSEVFVQSDESGYLHSLYKKVLDSPEFEPVRMDILQVPDNEAGERFVDQFLGALVRGQKPAIDRVSVMVPAKKARIMKHWATRVGALVRCDSDGDA